MGVSSNSHGRKSDKECQSPMLKIFKDIMQKEKHDPEKTNLLLNKKEDRKKKFFSSRNKTDRRSRESSSSEQRKRHLPFKTSIVDQRTAYDESRTHSIPFQNEKRDSWFFWGDTGKAKQTEDTCSCVSCALKKIISSEYACVGCLLVVLTISIVVAFLVVCKTVPTLVASEKPAQDTTVDSERLKRKIDMLNKRKKDFEARLEVKNPWKDAPVQMNGLSGIDGSEFGSSFRELNTIEDESKFTGDFINILDNEKISEVQNSERLRDFYRKLMQTDKQIRNLKKSYATPISDIQVMKTPDRIKRSLKLHNHFKFKPDAMKRVKVNKLTNRTGQMSPMKVKDHRFKRISNYTNEPTGFVIEKKKVLIRYKPADLKKVPKCSHTPKDSSTHEKQMKHPFYKNTQRLDELLDTFLSKNLPEIMSDPFGLDKLFHVDNEKAKGLKMVEPAKKQQAIKQEKFSDTDIMKILNPESTTDYQRDLYKQESDLYKDKVSQQKATTKSDYDIVLSVSTILNPGVNRIAKTPTIPLIDKVPNIRRLMQVNEDDENLGYEDMKEVLTGDIQNHDEFDGSSHDRQKRGEENKPQLKDHRTHNPMDVHNPNWKGPMPLYPDELTTIVKQSALHNKQMEFPVNTKDIKSEIDRTEKDLNDLEYVEDYLNNKYDKLVQMAQAYSDYGVLDGKKVEKEKNSAADEKTEHRVKLSVDTGLVKRGLFQRKKEDPHETDPRGMMINMMNSYNKLLPSEGIKFEIRPTSKSREDTLDLSKMLENHLKITHEDNAESLNLTNPNFSEFSTYPYVEMMYNTENYMDKSKLENNTQTNTIDDRDTSTEDNLQFSFAKGKRALLSIDLEREEVIEPIVTKPEAVVKDTYEIIEVTTTTNMVTDIENDTERNPENIESYSTTVVNENADTDKKNSTLYKNQPTANNNTVTIAMNSTEISFKNDSNAASNKNSNDTSADNIITEVSGKEMCKPSSTDKLHQISSVLVNNTEIIDNRSRFNEFLVTDEDEREDDYSGTYSFPLVLYFNEDANVNLSNIEISIIDPNEGNTEIKINNGTLNKRDVINPFENISEILEFNINENSEHTSDSNNTKHNITNVNNDSAVVNNNNSKNLSASDFFMMMSDWFAALEGINLNSNKTNLHQKDYETNATDAMYPFYDSAMIENIGHRSRVLLSIDDAVNTTDKSEIDDANASGVKSAGVGKTDYNLLNTSIPTKLNITQERDANIKANDKEKDGNKENRTIVKRNADESNLIFWNDMYDDEYGVETDRLDNAFRDKHSVKGNSLIKKSGLWMQEKIKKIAQNLKKSQSTTARTPTRRVSRETGSPDTDAYPKYVYDRVYNKIRKRQADIDEDDYDSNQKSIFTAMTNNMKEVCKKAARAVQKTRNIDVREDTKQETIATSLMQQLVRLMNDLVDYQVEQKTCAKLPADLQNFLEWLTSPEDNKSENEAQPVTFRNSYQDGVLGDLDLGLDDDNSISQQSLLYTNDNTGVDSKTECLGTLHDVQELMHQYEAMSDEDKSKMNGVKKYLEDQLDYLNKQISGYSDYNMYDVDTAPIKYRRDLAPQRRIKRRLKRRLHKFMKNFGKKHTRTTASYYEAVQVTDYEKKTEKKNANTSQQNSNDKIRKEIDTNEDEVNGSIENTVPIVKRNLKDVYYKAIADAKRLTTVESAQTHARKVRYGINEDIQQI